MPPPPKPGFVPEPGRSDDEHRHYKTQKGKELVDKILAEPDPLRREQLENELAQRNPHHYDVPAQPNWPLHNWPYKGPEFTKDMIPQSHFIARRGLPPEKQCYKRPTFAVDKYMAIHEGCGMHMKWNPRRRLGFAALTLGLPLFFFHWVNWLYWQRDARAGRIPRNNSFLHIISVKVKLPKFYE
eukprot:scpid90910/ scgid11470/ 